MNQAEDTYSRIGEVLPIISKYTEITELNTYILNELIERIVVHEKTVNEDGSKSRRVDIYYKFVGYIDAFCKNIAFMTFICYNYFKFTGRELR